MPLRNRCNQGIFPLGKEFEDIPVIESAVTSKGQTTLPKPVREALGVVPGDRVRYVIFDNNEVRMIPMRPLSRLFGAFKHEGPPVTLEDMERAIASGALDTK